MANGVDVGWIQHREENGAIFLGSIYVTSAMQRKGIGTRVIQMLLDMGKQRSQTSNVGGHEDQSRSHAI